MPASNLPVRASRLPNRGSKLPSRIVNDENAGRSAPVVKSSALPRRPLGNVTNASALDAPKPVVKPAARKASSVYTSAGLLSATNVDQPARRLYLPKETFLQATHSSIDDFDSDDECEDLLSISIDAPADDEVLVPTPSIRLLAPTGRVTDRFESTVRYHAIINEEAAKEANTPIWLPTGFLTAPPAYPDANPLPSYGTLDEVTKAAQEDDEVELLLDIDLDCAPQDGDVLVETPSIAVLSPQDKVVDEFRSEILHHWVAAAVPESAPGFGRLWTPSGFLDADNARLELLECDYPDSLHEQTRSRHDDAYFAQASFIMPREDDIDVGVPDIRIVNDAGKILDELMSATAFFWVAPDVKPTKPTPVPSSETIHKWFAERKSEVDVQPPFGYDPKPVSEPAVAKLPFPYGRGWSRKDIEANERIVHGSVRFPELLPPCTPEPKLRRARKVRAPRKSTAAPAQKDKKGVAKELFKKEKKALRNAPKALRNAPKAPVVAPVHVEIPAPIVEAPAPIVEAPTPVVTAPTPVVEAPVPEPAPVVTPAPSQPPASRLRAPAFTSRMPRPAFIPAPAAPVTAPVSPKKRAIRRPSALPQPAASSRPISLPATSAPVAKPRSAIPVRTSRLPVPQARPAVPGVV
ncbi:unnamed protein product [Peniophora sp. CBMAI 1063]|nr:unnamed protein product [Peniophora sp. CBMAI 1063]